MTRRWLTTKARVEKQHPGRGCLQITTPVSAREKGRPTEHYSLSFLANSSLEMLWAVGVGHGSRLVPGPVTGAGDVSSMISLGQAEPFPGAVCPTKNMAPASWEKRGLGVRETTWLLLVHVGPGEKEEFCIVELPEPWGPTSPLMYINQLEWYISEACALCLRLWTEVYGTWLNRFMMIWGHHDVTSLSY